MPKTCPLSCKTCVRALCKKFYQKKTRPVEVQNGYHSGESSNLPTSRLRRFKNKTKIVYMFMELALVKCVSRMSKLQTHVIHMVWSSELRRFFFPLSFKQVAAEKSAKPDLVSQKIHKITKTKPREEKTVTNALGPELRWWWNFWEETVILITPQTQLLFLGSIRRSWLGTNTDRVKCVSGFFLFGGRESASKVERSALFYWDEGDLFLLFCESEKRKVQRRLILRRERKEEDLYKPKP